LLVIDGGSAKTCQHQTGIAGYTLVSNSWRLLLATHQHVDDDMLSERADLDIHCTTEIRNNRKRRIRSKNTEREEAMRQSINELTALHEACQKGLISQKSA